MAVEIRRAKASDLSAAIGLLTAAGLPTEDLTPAHLALVAERDGLLLGAIGVEAYADTALVRSLVVRPDARSGGLGRKLLAALEQGLAEQGVRQLWLLTTDAAAYFEALGFVVQPRDAAPPAIQSSREFAALCPSDAVLMSKDLAS